MLLCQIIFFVSCSFYWLFMKYLLFPAIILLAGCQSLPSKDNDTNAEITATQLITADPTEINQALLADESIDVFHPVADVDFSLIDTKALVENIKTAAIVNNFFMISLHL